MSHKVILVTHTYLGKDDELGNKLFVNFWRTLAESIVEPDSICFLHEGVKMLLQDSPIIEPLLLMAKEGVHLYACRTCCDYYGISEQLATGRIVSMGDIQEKMFTGELIEI